MSERLPRTMGLTSHLKDSERRCWRIADYMASCSYDL